MTELTPPTLIKMSSDSRVLNSLKKTGFQPPITSYALAFDLKNSNGTLKRTFVTMTHIVTARRI